MISFDRWALIIVCVSLLALTDLGARLDVAQVTPHQKDAVISGRVLFSPGAVPFPGRIPEPYPVPQTLVMLKDIATAKAVAETTTDGNGAFHFRVPPGTYIIEAPGTSAHVTAKSGEEIHIDLAPLNP